ncbi:Bacteriophage protein [Mycobacteroides abscessus subsp. massiliense]|uniref:hypothetical protein n=1 Tax=Mycobacteroides abscessus TaxID=36809 RepID=UPI0009A849D0|nr:hypothetical protein [Mycobacteroides abscessus]SKU72341.1 Bacteriophage protein [Mycobacteroides abscessus subsp. massiliense]SKV04399.1 Bacteriophage protein [Mycobacteroides abscessus subsp. massiliense]
MTDRFGGKPVLLTAAGTGVDMWTGYPAEVARAVEDIWYFQPINYGPNGIPAIFPMGPSTDSGINEGVRLVLEEIPAGTPIGLCGYSQGGMVVSRLLDEFRTGRLKARQRDLVAGLTFGNPDREVDANGGRGISNRRIKGTPVDWWLDLFDERDIYGNVPNNDVGEDMTAIFRLVQLRGIDDLIGEDSLLQQALELVLGGGLAIPSNPLDLMGMLSKLGVTGPLSGFPAAVMAIVKAITFFGSKPATAPHIEYHLREISPGVTYLDRGIAFIREQGLAARAA